MGDERKGTPVDLHHRAVHREGIPVGDRGDHSRAAGGDHHAVLDGDRLDDPRHHVALVDSITHGRIQKNRPESLAIERGRFDPATQERAGVGTALPSGERWKGALHPVEDPADQPRSEFHVEWTASVLHRRADPEAARVLVHLDHRLRPGQADDLTDQAPATHPDHVVEAGGHQTLCDHHGPRHPDDTAGAHPSSSPKVMW